jgi:4'-phosphopantetheinyl transferase
MPSINQVRHYRSRLTMLELEPGQIHLWMTFFGEIRDTWLLQRYDRLLAPEEREQQRRFQFEIDRRRYLVTRALVRTVLSQYVAVAPHEWAFAANAYGKPEIVNADPRARQIAFNISHTRSLILLGITSNGVVGVDVENCRAREAPLKIANQFFEPKELAELRALPTAQQHDRFFEYWTLKESYIKARGIGLSIPLDWFGFQFSGERTVRISMRPELNDRPSRWRFWQFRPAAFYLAAVCAEATEANQRLFARKIVPLLHVENFDFGTVRTSDSSTKERPDLC